MLRNHPNKRIVDIATAIENFNRNREVRLQIPPYDRDIEDVYLKQLYHIANDEAICSPKLVIDIFDFVWLGLLSCTIEQGDSSAFELE